MISEELRIINVRIAEDAVLCELFSAPNSLLTGKSTGNLVTLTAILKG